jgi:hypothetical protein
MAPTIFRGSMEAVDASCAAAGAETLIARAGERASAAPGGARSLVPPATGNQRGIHT